MKGILGDINVQGHMELLRQSWESAAWQDVWARLALPLHTFAELGLPADESDAVVWRYCQQHQLVLLTANRNDDGPDSLESAIRDGNTPTSLPVFTMADADRVRHSSAYAEQVAVKLLEYFLDIDKLRGTGRMYVP
ncbi:MAG: hypothetical protein L0Z62_49795 [Gemmataceae bacterium]|nr:hypothetical protein [Gemmataceae bacterium]